MVQILDYTSGARRLVATVQVVDDEPVIDGSVPARIRQEILATYDRAKRDEERFFNLLPQVFSGSYIRAKRVG